MSKVANKSEQNIAIPEHMDVQDMDARVKSMMEAGPNVLPHGKGQIRAKICKVCGKEGAPSAIRDHIWKEFSSAAAPVKRPSSRGLL